MSDKNKQSEVYKALIIIIAIIAGVINGYELFGVQGAIIEAFFLGLVGKDIGRNLYRSKKE